MKLIVQEYRVYRAVVPRGASALGMEELNFNMP